MTRTLRNAAILLAALVLTAPAFAQRAVWRTSADIVEGVSGSMIGTVVDTNEGSSQITIQGEEDRYGQVTVATDSVSTQYNGFGDVINGKPEIFTGSRGFANLREGDRVEVRGVGRGNGIIRADQITLLGRTVSAPQTGVGDTRSPSAGISTPTVGSTATVYGRIDGVIRQVNAADNRIVVETDRREIFNIRASSATPVYYRNATYQLSNLEVGDRVSIDSDGSPTTDREIRARSIQVTQAVQESHAAGVSSVSGRITSIDRARDTARLGTARGEVRVDMSRAYDANGRRVRAADLQIGDRIDISGSRSNTSDLFSATTVRFVDEDVFSPGQNPAPGTGTTDTGYAPELVTVTVSGTITETLQNAPTLTIRDRTSSRLVILYVAEDFAVRTKSGGYTTADKLNVNDSVLVKAYRDADGNMIAQTIRMR